MSSRSKFRQQHPKIVTNSKSPTVAQFKLTVTKMSLAYFSPKSHFGPKLSILYISPKMNFQPKMDDFSSKIEEVRKNRSKILKFLAEANETFSLKEI